LQGALHRGDVARAVVEKRYVHGVTLAVTRSRCEGAQHAAPLQRI